MESVKIATASHYTHTLWNAASAGDMGIVLGLGICSNNLVVLSGGDLPHKSNFLCIECPCVHESDCGVHYAPEFTLHMYIEYILTGLLYVTLKVLLVLCGIWSLDFFHSVIPPCMHFV